MARALAQRLHSVGCTLYLSDVNEAGLAATAASLTGDTPLRTTVVDVAERCAVEDWPRGGA